MTLTSLLYTKHIHMGRSWLHLNYIGSVEYACLWTTYT